MVLNRMVLVCTWCVVLSVTVDAVASVDDTALQDSVGTPRVGHRLAMFFPLLLGISGRLAALIPTALMAVFGVFLFVAFSKKALLISLLALGLSYMDKYRKKGHTVIHLHKHGDHGDEEEVYHSYEPHHKKHWHKAWKKPVHKVHLSSYSSVDHSPYSAYTADLVDSEQHPTTRKAYKPTRYRGPSRPSKGQSYPSKPSEGPYPDRNSLTAQQPESIYLTSSHPHHSTLPPDRLEPFTHQSPTSYVGHTYGPFPSHSTYLNKDRYNNAESPHSPAYVNHPSHSFPSDSTYLNRNRFSSFPTDTQEDPFTPKPMTYARHPVGPFPSDALSSFPIERPFVLQPYENHQKDASDTNTEGAPVQVDFQDILRTNLDEHNSKLLVT